MSELLGQLSPPLLLAVGWLLIVAEAGLLIGVVLPGTSVLVALGYFSHLGVLPLGVTIAVAASAAVTGTQLSYLWGRRRRGSPSAHVLADRLAPGLWERGRRLVVRRGVWAVVGAQWLGSARTLVPRLAGWAGLPYRSFASASVPVACAWAATLVTLSRYLAPEVIRQVTGHLALAGPVAMALVLLALYPRYRRARGGDQGSAGDDEVGGVARGTVAGRGGGVPHGHGAHGIP
ncbi:DedA family protein [Sphaerisporangium viridialbum]|uniref:DedA family protein n=1 Tax=Sphaerisporangium viridialbum TaxID=46189 RepID=UPI003C7568FC